MVGYLGCCLSCPCAGGLVRVRVRVRERVVERTNLIGVGRHSKCE